MALQNNLLLWVARIGVVPVAMEIIKYLYENDRLTEEINKLLLLLKNLAPVNDPVEKLSRAIFGTDEYLHSQQTLPPELSDSLIKRLNDLNQRLDLARTLDGNAKRKLLKSIRRDFFNVLEQALPIDDALNSELGKPKKLRARILAINPVRRKSPAGSDLN